MRSRFHTARHSMACDPEVLKHVPLFALLDEEETAVVADEPSHGEFFGFASMLEQTPHQTDAVALDDVVCIEVDQEDIAVLLRRKPLAWMDMLRVLGRQFHASQQLVRLRASRHPNEVIDKDEIAAPAPAA